MITIPFAHTCRPCPFRDSFQHHGVTCMSKFHFVQYQFLPLMSILTGQVTLMAAIFRHQEPSLFFWVIKDSLRKTPWNFGYLMLRTGNHLHHQKLICTLLIRFRWYWLDFWPKPYVYDNCNLLKDACHI